MAAPQDDPPRLPPPAAAPEAGPAPAGKPAAEPKSFLVRTFSLNMGQALRLLGLSTLTGFFVLAFDFAPTGASFDVGGAFTAIIHRTFTAIGWALESFWKPALAGALIVMPVWTLWRLVRAPFRK